MNDKIIQVCNIAEEKGFANPQAGRVYSTNGLAPTLNTCGGGQREPKILQYPHGWNRGLEYNDGICPSTTKSSWEHNNFIKYDNMEQKKQITLPQELEGKKFRIRKLTERECFRLMGVDDADIDKIQASGISRSAQYKLAGNSIVVDVLYHLFLKMFVETEREDRQLTIYDLL